jgi:hypothetical protein
MTRIRPFVKSDIPSVVALRRRTFTHSAQQTTGNAERYFREIFFDGPWVDPELPSLVYEDAAGQVVGFSGVLARRMCFRGEAIRVAVATQFAVAPESRGLAGVQLIKRVFSGPQDLTLADVVNQPTRLLWERLGGVTLPLHSLHWTHALAPVTCSVMSIPGSIMWRAARRAARHLWRIADAAVTAGDRAREREFIPGQLLDFDALDGQASALANLSRSSGGGLTGSYSAAELTWLLSQLARKAGLGQLQVVAVRDSKACLLGWYAYSGVGGATGEVAHVAAQAGEYAVVVAHLVAHARSRGLLALRGRVDPRHVRDCQLRSELNGDGPWVLVHTRRPELLAALHRSDACLSRLDGEWWLNF